MRKLSLFKNLRCPLSADSDGAARPRQRRKETRPGELLTAALTLFVERGYSATRLDDVATLAGVTKGTLYLYYENKEALFKAVVEHNVVPLVEDVRRQTREHQGAYADLLCQLLLGWWEQVGATPIGGIIKLMVSESGNFPEVAKYHHDAVIVPMREIIGEVIRQGMARGEFRAVDVESCFHAIIAPLLMLALWRNSFAMCGQDLDNEAYLRTTIDLTLNGLLREKNFACPADTLPPTPTEDRR